MTKEEAREIVKLASISLAIKRAGTILCTICMHDVPIPGCKDKEQARWCNFNIDEADCR